MLLQSTDVAYQIVLFPTYCTLVKLL